MNFDGIKFAKVSDILFSLPLYLILIGYISLSKSMLTAILSPFSYHQYQDFAYSKYWKRYPAYIVSDGVPAVLHLLVLIRDNLWPNFCFDQMKYCQIYDNCLLRLPGQSCWERAFLCLHWKKVIINPKDFIITLYVFLQLSFQKWLVFFNGKYHFSGCNPYKTKIVVHFVD